MIVAIMALMSVGCASKGDLNTLSGRVDALEAAEKTQTADIEQLKQNQEALAAHVNEIDAKLDRVFAKGKK